MVPAGHARDVGFDRSLIGAYGHDDRVCAYAAFKPRCWTLGTPVNTAVSRAGRQGGDRLRRHHRHAVPAYLEYVHGGPVRGGHGRSRRRMCFEHSFCLSADVNSGALTRCMPRSANPTQQRVAQLRHVASVKYTGCARQVRHAPTPPPSLWATCAASVATAPASSWQTGELGKVDHGRRRHGGHATWQTATSRPSMLGVPGAVHACPDGDRLQAGYLHDL